MNTIIVALTAVVGVVILVTGGVGTWLFVNHIRPLFTYRHACGSN